MRHDVPPSLDRPANERVFTSLRDQSAHGDIAAQLLSAVTPLGDVQSYCPDTATYRYVVVSTKGVVFGLAVGMNTIAFRLDPRMKTRALETGGIPWPPCGDDWVAVAHHRPDDDWPAVDVPFWARKAYAFAREFPSDPPPAGLESRP